MRFSLLFFCWLMAGFTVQAAETKVVSGTILLNSKTCPDFKKIKAELPANWYLRIDSANISDKTAVFSCGGATVMLAYLDYSVNADEIALASAISWLWKDAEKEAKGHKAQLVVSVLGDASVTLELYRIFTRAAAGAMAQINDAPGLYMNEQYLLLPKGFYQEAARNMGREGTPVYCWVYFGLLQQGEKSAGYTYGLTEFGQLELEITDSSLPLQDAHTLVYEVAQKAVASAKFTDGQQIELTDSKKVVIKLSKAQLIRDNIQTAKITTGQ